MIGLAGCGRMGRPMLEALRDGGTKALGFDVVPKGPDYITRDVDTFVADLTTLFCVVRDQEQLESLLFGPQAIIDRAARLDRVFICSTVSPRYVLALRDRVPQHIDLIDAPMSGAVIGAENRSLTFMLGGSEQDISDATPILALMGKHFFHLGPYGAGMQAKVLNNLLAASHTAMTRLVLEWAEAAELDTDKMLAMIEASSGQNWFASKMSAIEFSKDGYSPDNSIGILAKDVAAALDAAPRSADTELPQTLQRALEKLRPLAEQASTVKRKKYL